jgi:RNA polymerase sigma-70 factor (ECF subfamily)
LTGPEAGLHTLAEVIEMPDDSKEGQPSPRGRFATTRWSVILAAGRRAQPGWKEALSTLCEVYWYPLYAFARRTGMPPEQAQDLTQEFFTRLLEKDSLRHADPQKGRFRSFLLTSFKHFAADERDRARAQKRGGGQAPISFDVETAEGLYTLEPSHEQTPEKLFERRWALTILRRTVVRLGLEHAEPRKERQFRLLKAYLPGGPGGPSYAKTARDLDLNEVTVKVMVHRLRQRFRDLLLEEIACTVDKEEDVEAEVRHLLAALEAP